MDTRLSNKLAELQTKVMNRPSDPDDARISLHLRCSLQEHDGNLEAAVRWAFPRLTWEGVTLPPAEPLESFLPFWREWEQADWALTRCGQYSGGNVTAAYDAQVSGRSARDTGCCPGQSFTNWRTLDGLPTAEHCRLPSLKPDGTVTWAACPANERAIRHVQDSWWQGCGVPCRFLSTTLDTFDTSPSPSLALALRRVRQFVAELTPGMRALWSYDAGIGQKGLVIVGPCGTGKTHLAVGVMAALTRQNVLAQFITMPSLAQTLRAAIAKNKVDETMERWLQIPVLVVDDLGKEYLGASGGYDSGSWMQEKVFELVDGRYTTMRPTFLTSNLGDEYDGLQVGQKARYQGLVHHYGAAVVSRLRESCDWLTLDVPDRRRAQA